MVNDQHANTVGLDLPQQQAFIRYYGSLPEKPPTTVRFFLRSDYYTSHAEDATLVAQMLHGQAVVKQMGEQPKLSYVVISKGKFEGLVRDILLVKKYRIELYVRPAQSRSNDWEVRCKASPGNLAQFEDMLFDDGGALLSGSSIIAIQLCKNKMVALCSVNTLECQFSVCEFHDNEFFTELDFYLAQIGPKECIIPAGNTDELQKLEKVLSRSGILVEKVKKTEYSHAKLDQDLNRLLYFYEDQQRNSAMLPEFALTDAMNCLQVAIKYLGLQDSEGNFGQFKLGLLETSQYMRVDNTALLGLNFLPKPGESPKDSTTKLTSVFGLLNNCCTTHGQRLLDQWIKHPLKDINLITERLEIVEQLVTNSEVRQSLRNSVLPSLPDLLPDVKKLSSKRATLQHCYNIYMAVDSMMVVVQTLRKLENKYADGMLVEPLVDLLTDMENYQKMIEETIDLNAVKLGEYLINPNFKKELLDLSGRKSEIEEKIQRTFRNSAADLGLDGGKVMKLEHNSQHGYFFRVTLKEEPILRQNSQYRIIDAVKGGCRFTTSRLSDLNDRHKEIIEGYEQAQRGCVTEILEVAAGYANTIRNLNICISKVDVLVSFAIAAIQAPIPYVKPRLHSSESGIMRLKKVRHPCIELQERMSFVANDVHFERDKKHLHIITGPNMGGKSTYMRSVGVCALMAHIGSLVPCEAAEISVLDAIMSRVGGDDSQLKGLSTFMMEMVETSSIVWSTTSNSLVIVDELGRGTSTSDGCGIAWAVAQYLAMEKKCFTLFATHFHEITRLPDICPTAHNLHVTLVATEKTITPLFQVQSGPCDKSFGIHCARMVGFPDDVIQDAVKNLADLEYSQKTKYVNDFEPELRQQQIQEADDIILKAITDISELDVDSMSDQELTSVWERLRREAEESGNLVVKALLES